MSHSNFTFSRSWVSQCWMLLQQNWKKHHKIMLNTFSVPVIIETWAQEINRGPGNKLGARRAQQFSHLGNYTLTPAPIRHWINTRLWKSKAISSQTKLLMFRRHVWWVALYACETWTLKKAWAADLNFWDKMLSTGRHFSSAGSIRLPITVKTDLD